MELGEGGENVGRERIGCLQHWIDLPHFLNRLSNR